MTNTDLSSLITDKKPEFTSTEVKLANFILNNPEKLNAISTISRFSKESNFSVGSIMRFCKKLGFDGFSEFKFFLTNNMIEFDTKDEKGYLDILLDIYSNEMIQFKNQLNIEGVQKLVDQINKSDLIISIGKNNSFTSASQFQLRLNRQGFKSVSFDDESTILNYVDILSPKDLVILFSVSGYGSNDYISIIESYQNNNIPIVLVTMNKNTELYRICKEVIYIPNTRISKNHMALDGQILFLLFIDLLIHMIANAKHKQQR